MKMCLTNFADAGTADVQTAGAPSAPAPVERNRPVEATLV